MIWNMIKKIILSGIVSWIGFIIILILGAFKTKSDLSEWIKNFIVIKDYDKINYYIKVWDKKGMIFGI